VHTPRCSVLTLAGLTFSAAAAFATQPTRLLWQRSGVENVVSIAAIEDIDQDAVPEVLFESYYAGAPATDHLFAVSGASAGTGEVIWSARPLGGPSNSGGYGEYCLRISPDLTGDGASDVLYGAAWGNRSAFLLNGATGATVWSFDTYADSPPNPPVSGWIYAIAPLGSDLTDDGLPEVVFCAGSDNHCVYCANGSNGQILWHYRGQDAFDFVDSIGDVNDDGVRDVLAAQTDTAPRVFVFSGAGGPSGTAQILWSVSQPSAVWSCCELVLPEPAAPTIVVGCWDGNLRGYEARAGGLRWTAPVGDPVMRVVPIADVSGDGIDDIGVGSWDNAGRVHSGADGQNLWRTPVGTLNGGDCWTCDPVGDTNGDGRADLAVGSFDEKVYLMDGVTGAVLWNATLGDRVFCVRGVPDLTGNGIPDVAAGTQYLNGSGGICYTFEGNDAITVSAPAACIGTTVALTAHPNPSHGAVRLAFEIDSPATDAGLDLFDLRGRRVATLHTGPAGPGRTEVVWDGAGRWNLPLPAGIYLARLRLDDRPGGVARVVRLP
jgi:outer membrane protein assembly factor BamB